jgi:large subunit ribosomal protein L28
MRCEICLKSVMYGNNVSHSKRRTKTTFKPNVHKQTLVQDGKAVKIKICTRCLRSRSRGQRVRRALV